MKKNKLGLILISMLLVNYVFADACVFLASANQNELARYTMDSKTGALTQINGYIDAHGIAPEFVTTYNDNKNLMTVNRMSSTLSLFKLDSKSCNLIFMGNTTTGMEPSRATQVGQYLYVANNSSNSISQFKINTDGTLTKLTIPELRLTNFTNPSGIKADPSGKYLMVVSKTMNKVMSLLIDNKTGQLSQVSGSLIQTGISPKSPKFDKYGHVIIPSAGENKLNIYNFNPNTGILSSFQTISSYGVTPQSGTFIDDTTFCLANLNTNAVSIFKYNGTNYVFEKNITTLTQGGPPILQDGYLYMTGNSNQLITFQRTANDEFKQLRVMNTLNNPYNLVFVNH